jgi:serine/threonine-protein kinase RsbW
MDDEVVELEIPARPDYLALTRLLASSLASLAAPLGDGRIDDLRLAVSEACANAMEAYDEPGGRTVVVRWTIGKEELAIEVLDHGTGFDPDSLPEHPPVTHPVRLEFERGLGIPLIRALTDDLTFDSGPQGTRVRFVLRSEDAVQDDADS